MENGTCAADPPQKVVVPTQEKGLKQKKMSLKIDGWRAFPAEREEEEAPSLTSWKPSQMRRISLLGETAYWMNKDFSEWAPGRMVMTFPIKKR
jgi:hypothetical protein